MKRNVRKKILLLTVCAMIVGALLLTGCRPPNNIDDPWLDTWQAVVVDRSVEVEKVEISMRRGAFSSFLSPIPQSTENKDEIADILDALNLNIGSFELIANGEDEAFDDARFMADNYRFDFYLAGTDEIFTVKCSKAKTIYCSIDDDRFLYSEAEIDEEFFDVVKGILGIEY